MTPAEIVESEIDEIMLIIHRNLHKTNDQDGCCSCAAREVVKHLKQAIAMKGAQ